MREMNTNTSLVMLLLFFLSGCVASDDYKLQSNDNEISRVPSGDLSFGTRSTGESGSVEAGASANTDGMGDQTDHDFSFGADIGPIGPSPGFRDSDITSGDSARSSAFDRFDRPDGARQQRTFLAANGVSPAGNPVYMRYKDRNELVRDTHLAFQKIVETTKALPNANIVDSFSENLALEPLPASDMSELNRLSGREVEKVIKAAEKYLKTAQVEISEGSSESHDHTGLYLEMASAAISLSREAKAERAFYTSKNLASFGTQLVDIGLSVTPVISWGKDLAEVCTGTNAVTGKELDSFDYTFAIAGVLSGGILSKLKNLKYVKKFVSRVARSFGRVSDTKIGQLDDIISKTKMTPEKTKALTGYEYNAVLNPGPLISVKDGVLANGAPRITTPYLTFLGGKYSEFITEQNTKLYRAVSSNQKYIKLKNGDIGHGTGSYAGAFYVDQPFVSKLQGRIDAAILPEWSDMTKMEVVELKKGTKYFKGPIAPQGDVFLGGQDKMQTYLLPEARKMVRVLEVKELK